MSRIFYKDASSLEQARQFYREAHDNVYDRTKEKIIAEVSRGIYSLPEWRGKEVLDVGCGGGIFTRFFLDLDAKVTALDRSLYALEANKAKNPGAKFICGDAIHALPKKKFHLIFAKDIIEHIEKDGSFLEKAAEHLRAGGYLLINTQNSFSLNYAFQKTCSIIRGRKNWMGWDPGHIRFYNPFELKKKLINHHIAPIRWFGSYYFPYRSFAKISPFFAEADSFRAVELLHLWDKILFGQTGWNLGVLGRKK